MHPLLLETEHRPIPMPEGPWVMKQTWNDLLFAHWALPAEKIRPLVPQELELDLRDGQAYVAVTPFWISGLRLRKAPPFPGVHKFCELNVRTYVRVGDIPGVFFFSLDAGSMLAVFGARASFGLPYLHAAMQIRSLGETYEYSCRRLQEPRPAEFHGTYRPVSAPRKRSKGDLEHFLTERYCLYTVRDGKVRRAYIHHLPWPLQDASAEIGLNTVAKASRIELPGSKPLLHFSRTMEVLVWWPEDV